LTLTAPPLLRAEGLAKRYQSGQSVLEVFADLDLEVARGERLALVGPSGAGKSSLLHLLGLLDAPSAGRLFLDGRELTGLPEPELARVRNAEIGFVWQTNTLLPEFTAEENAAMPLLIRGEAVPSAVAAARERLAEVGLADRAHHRAGELSGGEQQRVVLARALAGRPRLLLADEPTGNLDEATGGRIMELLEQLHAAHGLTSVYVTHNMAFARRAERVLELRHGRLQPV
jgi:lipoprotein-releasing system ATP-binding protein